MFSSRGRGRAVRFVIMGCGRTGSSLAHLLENRGHTVAIIDQNPDSFRRLGSSFEGRRVTGVGFDRDTLSESGIAEAYAFAAVSNGDNSNILAARVARETFGVSNVVARIYDPGRAEVYQRLGITTVATVKWTADQVLRRLLPVGAEPDFRDPSGTIRVDQVPAPTAWVGHQTIEFQTGSGSFKKEIEIGNRFSIIPIRITGGTVYVGQPNTLGTISPEVAPEPAPKAPAKKPVKKPAAKKSGT